MVTRRVSVEQRRARLAVRHRLSDAGRADGPVEVADSLVALHATDPASVFLSQLARLRTPDVEAVSHCLYADRSLIRMLGMRRTMFTVSLAVAPVVQAACTTTIAARQRALLLRHLAEAGVAADCEAWLRRVEADTLAALTARGEAFAAELSEDVPLLRTPLTVAEGKAYEAQQYVCTRVLFLLAADGHIVRGRPRGSWISSQYRWAPLRSWVSGGLPDWPVEAAQVELARRWLHRFGPATVDDLCWWSGWPRGQTRKVLAQLAPVEVELDGQPGIVLAEDLDLVPAAPPWVALLPALDATPMGWAGRDWYLGPHRLPLFDRSGNIGPTVWCDGRIVGGWAQRRSGEVAVRLLQDIGSAAGDAVAQLADRLTGMLGAVRITPRFRTTLERELCS